MNIFQKTCTNCSDVIEFKSKKSYYRSKPDREYLCKSCALSITHKGKVISKEHKQKLRDIRLGSKLSEETKKQLSDLKKGKNNPCFGRSGKLNPMYGKSGSLSPTFGHSPWIKGKHHTEEAIKKMKVFASGKWIGEKNPNYGNHKPLSDEHRRKVRLSHIRRIEIIRNGGYQLKPNFNPNACKVIDEYGKQNGYNFQHAMNGGEFYIKALGYWVDGYDKDKNVVIDYYEKNHHHYNRDGDMKEKDIRRINEIKHHLGCQFIIIEEKN